MHKHPDQAPRDQWVLIRKARQLVTLHGPSGARRGAAMNEISVVPDGALLIRNGVIQESGPSRRIENLQQARAAREIDATGRIVMPAFVDPDAVLVLPTSAGVALRVVSKKRLEIQATATAAAYARAGVLTVGAHTGWAADLRECTKTLRIHQGLQNKPLRIRSIFSPRSATSPEEMIAKWIPASRERRLASIFELTLPGSADLRQAATAGASAGYSLRLRSAEPLSEESNELALAAGTVAIVAPPSACACVAARLSAMGCIHILRACDALPSASELAAPRVRAQISEGSALALASSYSPTAEFSTFNPQYLLYLGVTQFGLTPEEAICATTWNAACSLRMSHVTGSLEPNKMADLILMDAPDYRDLVRRAGHNDLLFAMRAGQIIYRRANLGVD